MAEQQTEKKTISVWLGTLDSPLEVIKASTGYDGMKAGRSKGKVYLEVKISQSQVDAVERVPEVAALIVQANATVEGINAPINLQLQTPNLPQSAVDKIKTDLGAFTDWKSPLFVDPDKGDYTPVTNEAGEQMYSMKFTQNSIGLQLGGATPKPLDKLFRIQHILKDDVTGTFSKILKDENGFYAAKSIFSGAKIVLRINTLVSKHPTKNNYGLTTSRLVGIIHVAEGAASGGAVESVGYDPMAGVTVTEEVTVSAPRTDAPTDGTPPVNPAAGQPAVVPYGAPADPNAQPYATPAVPVQPAYDPNVVPVAPQPGQPGYVPPAVPVQPAYVQPGVVAPTDNAYVQPAPTAPVAPQPGQPGYVPPVAVAPLQPGQPGYVAPVTPEVNPYPTA